MTSRRKVSAISLNPDALPAGHEEATRAVYDLLVFAGVVRFQETLTLRFFVADGPFFFEPPAISQQRDLHCCAGSSTRSVLRSNLGIGVLLMSTVYA
jgi:hypothetical protein